jgi:hypothetical protein
MESFRTALLSTARWSIYVITHSLSFRLSTQLLGGFRPHMYCVQSSHRAHIQPEGRPFPICSKYIEWERRLLCVCTQFDAVEKHTQAILIPCNNNIRYMRERFFFWLTVVAQHVGVVGGQVERPPVPRLGLVRSAFLYECNREWERRKWSVSGLDRSNYVIARRIWGHCVRVLLAPCQEVSSNRCTLIYIRVR